jgi:uncharacterized protein (TIGR03790 family)
MHGKILGFPGRKFLQLALFGLLPLLAFAENETLPKKRSSDQVLLVVNENSPISEEIGKDYARKRHVRNILFVRCPDFAEAVRNETIGLAAYTKLIESPVRGYLATRTNIDFVVLTKGIPIRITGAALGSCSDQSHEPVSTRGHPSVDSYLAALDYTNFSDATKIDITGSGAVGCAFSNRYWNATQAFSHARYGGYLVTRLDGDTAADAKALVTRALEAEAGLTNGEVLLDVQPSFGLGDKATQPAPIRDNVIPQESAWSEFNADMRHAHDLLVERGVLTSWI